MITAIYTNKQNKPLTRTMYADKDLKTGESTFLIKKIISPKNIQSPHPPQENNTGIEYNYTVFKTENYVLEAGNNATNKSISGQDATTQITKLVKT